jgi:hypothetical protein
LKEACEAYRLAGISQMEENKKQKDESARLIKGNP